MNLIECMEVFIEVAKGLSFSKAAKRLGVSPSVVSKKIVWLETEFATSLLNRNTRRVSLTESGTLLLQNVDTLMHAMKDLKDLVRSSSAARQRPHPRRVAAFLWRHPPGTRRSGLFADLARRPGFVAAR